MTNFNLKSYALGFLYGLAALFIAISTIGCSDSLNTVYNANNISEDIRSIKEEHGDSIKNNIQNQIKYSIFNNGDVVGKTYEEILVDYSERQLKINLLKEDMISVSNDIFEQIRKRTKVMDSLKAEIKFEIIRFSQWKSNSYSSFYEYGTEVKVTLPKGIVKVVASYYPSFNGEYLFFASDKSWRNKTYRMIDSYNSSKISGFDLDDVSHSLYFESIITEDGENIYQETYFPKVEGYEKLQELAKEFDKLGGDLSSEELSYIKSLITEYER